MTIVVIGPGALGCLFAALLASRTDHSVWLLGHDAERTRKIESVLTLAQGEAEITVPIRLTSNAEEVGTADLLFLCVKSQDVRRALQNAGSLFSQNTLLVAFQNGLAHVEILEEVIGAVLVGLGTTSQGATLLAPGHVKHAGLGPTWIGPHPSCSGNERAAAMLRRAAEMLSVSTISTTVTDDIMAKVWKKLLINTGINALTAIYNCKNGQLLKDTQAYPRLQQAVLAAVQVAQAQGVAVDGDPVADTRSVCEATAENISSMLQDVRKKKRTEIDAINGFIVRQAALLGVAVPENEKLVQQIKEIERAYLPEFS